MISDNDDYEDVKQSNQSDDTETLPTFLLREKVSLITETENLNKLMVYTSPTLIRKYCNENDNNNVNDSDNDNERKIVNDQSVTNTFHYLINEQAKSLAVLQELQNDVVSLFEFRDAVIEAFPSLRSKLQSATVSPINSTLVQPLVTNSLKNHSHNQNCKQLNKHVEVVQDSGFSTETSTSKDNQIQIILPNITINSNSNSNNNNNINSNSNSNVNDTDSISNNNKPNDKNNDVNVNENEEELNHLLNVLESKSVRLKQTLIDTTKALDNSHQNENRYLIQINVLQKNRDFLLQKINQLEHVNKSNQVHIEQLEHTLKAVSHDQDLTAIERKLSKSKSKPKPKLKSKSKSIPKLDEAVNQLSFGNETLPKLKSAPNLNVIKAICRERDVINLQKHLLISTMRTQELSEKIASLDQNRNDLPTSLNHAETDTLNEVMVSQINSQKSLNNETSCLRKKCNLNDNGTRTVTRTGNEKETETKNTNLNENAINDQKSEVKIRQSRIPLFNPSPKTTNNYVPEKYFQKEIISIKNATNKKVHEVTALSQQTRKSFSVSPIQSNRNNSTFQRISNANANLNLDQKDYLKNNDLIISSKKYGQKKNYTDSLSYSVENPYFDSINSSLSNDDNHLNCDSLKYF